ncbi:hypothetical protein H4R34_001065 [Dimargaris verticillata]|uniref:Scamp family-domain-containing protein n=1 Tax=Dimargaris verticillata TaxID=2761393 RepID=A0A9W8BAL0_9FUNG|nr:hypothetical protein H4R34_001065 [Dimargaris verticillata]
MAYNNHGDNPFADDRYEVHDPFADPTITHALNSTQIAADDGQAMGAHHTSPATADMGAHASHQSGRAMSRTNSQPMDSVPLGDHLDDRHSIDVGTHSSRGPQGRTDLSNLEAELRQREERLAQRERELQAQSEEIRKSGRPPNNFPPCYPLFYLNIDAEIPDIHRNVMRRIWWYWLYLEGNLVFNCITCLIMVISNPEGVSSTAADFGASFGYLFTITLLSFFMWYRPVYNAYMKEKSLYYMFYFVFGGLHIIYTLYMAAGIPYSGSGGLINALSMFSAGKVVAGVFCLLDTVAWIVGGLFALYMYRLVRLHYNSQGHTFEQAKAQAVSSVATNKTVQQAGVNYATSQMQNRV